MSAIGALVRTLTLTSSRSEPVPAVGTIAAIRLDE